MVMNNKALLLSLIAGVASAENGGVEYPDIFDRRDGVTGCEDHGVVAAWCDSRVLTDLECGILTEFDEYGCTCYGKSALCPTECIGGTEPVVKTHYGIRCAGIPPDEVRRAAACEPKRGSEIKI